MAIITGYNVESGTKVLFVATSDHLPSHPTNIYQRAQMEEQRLSEQRICIDLVRFGVKSSDYVTSTTYSGRDLFHGICVHVK